MTTVKHLQSHILFFLTLFFTCLPDDKATPLTLSIPGESYAEDIIYNPARGTYSGGSTIPSTKKEDCPFCKKLALNNDAAYLILARYKHTYVMLCEYPYLIGHILILPLEHHSTLPDFPRETRNEFIEVLCETISIMNDYFKPEGLNIGINMGKGAGGSVPGHMHLHILPRKTGDVSFLTVIAKTHAIFADMNKLYADLRAKFKALNLDGKQKDSAVSDTNLHPQS